MANYYLWKARLCNKQAKFKLALKDVTVNVGDLADVTYSAAGWTAQPVRIVAMETTPAGQMEITVEVYDASVHNELGIPDDYNERPHLPAPTLPPDVTSLALEENKLIAADD